VLLGAGCDDASGPEGLPFGRTGQVRIQVRSASEPQGAQEQTVVWSSNGTWRLTERISYRNALGDETVRRSSGDPSALAQRYSSWIALVNAPGGPVQLLDVADPAFSPPCEALHSVVTVTIFDAQRADSISWSRCAHGSLGTISAEVNVPPNDAQAGRVIEAAKQVRNLTLATDREFTKQGHAYTGSLPFRTIDRGELSNVPLVIPRLIEDALTWNVFWAMHDGGVHPLPPVDFANELVLVAAVGTRQEAGDSVEVRRVLQVQYGTQISMYERRPGDFCTPAQRTHTPYHIVAAPVATSPRPIHFSLESTELVSCR
jgi:hypothetical protein